MQEGDAKQEEDDMGIYAKGMHELKRKIYENAIINIRDAQERQKKMYDKKHCKRQVGLYNTWMFGV